jgi:hypothetical protein
VAVAEGDALRVRIPYSPHRPEPRQHAFLVLDGMLIDEALYGGAAGGGKSDTLLMAALRYVHVPGYAALLLRRTYQDLSKPGALMDRAKQWLAGRPGVTWSERDFRFNFASGAALDFGYLKTANDKYQYQSAEYQFIGFDELTQFPKADYTYLFSRLRRPSLPADRDPTEDERRRIEALSRVPLRMRAASNPGGLGHDWVKARFVDFEVDVDDSETAEEQAESFRRRVFIPARLKDNPHVDQEAYRRSLSNLDRVERARLEDGDWDADDGTKFLNGNDLAAVAALGSEFDELAARGELPPPAGGWVALSFDFGDHTHALLGYALSSGGLYVPAGEQLEGYENSEAADRLLGVKGGDRFGLLDRLPPFAGRRKVKDPLLLVRELRYDAAGLQDMRTVAKRARLRHRNLKVRAVPFGNYKRETAHYLRHLVERAGDGERTRILAISPEHAPTLLKQLRGLLKDPKDRDVWLKDDDHGPDSLVAMLSDIAARNRARLNDPPKPDPTSTGAIRPGQRP